MSPCGLPVDLLRAGYTTRMRFWRDSDTTVSVRWYRVPRERPFLPFATPFVSAQWFTDDTLKGEFPGTVFQGEDLFAERPFSPGLEPYPPGVPAGHVCGSADQWGGDLLIGRDPGLPQSISGEPLCCDPALTLPRIRTTHGGVVLNCNWASYGSSPNFFGLHPVPGVGFQAINGRVHCIEGSPPVPVDHAVVWTAVPSPGGIVVTSRWQTGVPPVHFFAAYVGRSTPGVTVPLPVSDTDSGGVTGSTVEVSGYSPP